MDSNFHSGEEMMFYGYEAEFAIQWKQNSNPRHQKVIEKMRKMNYTVVQLNKKVWV